ncbi:MAG: PIF1 family DEAD/DEAH box helicase [Patescibacteria group bacterium]
MKQLRAFDILKEGHNVLLTGSAGSGKTFVLNKYIEYLKGKGKNVAITASTGIAATHINGLTLHAWAGLGAKDSYTEKEVKKIVTNKNVAVRVRLASVLIIDEISMLNDFHLDVVETVCRKIRKRDKPFGGLQVVLSGDFFQLAPIGTNGGEGNFVHRSEAWDRGNFKVCYLEEQYRHTDAQYTKMLSDIRKCNVTAQTRNYIESRLNKPVTGKLVPTKIYTHNKAVDEENDRQLERIKGKEHIYQMTDKGKAKLVTALKKYCLAPENLVLKKGAIVMFVKNNFEKGYVNGTIGKIVGFDEDDHPIVETAKGNKITALPAKWIVEEDNVELARIGQIPLRLAWAITVHKSQGMTLDMAEIDLSRSFTTGMGYVALSRLRELAGLKLLGINQKAYEVSAVARDLDKRLLKMSVGNE